MPRPCRRRSVRLAPLLPLALALAACQAGGDGAAVPGDRADTRPFAGIGAAQTVRFTGTEPFWGGEVTGAAMIFRTPEAPDGEPVAVTRFAGRGGLSFSGARAGAPLTLTVTPGACGDGMSDRAYPFVATLRLGDALRSGCAWTAEQPFTEPAAP